MARTPKDLKRARRRRFGLALGLWFLSPFVGEYLLGNQPITELPALLLLAPMYGGGAVLIREVARRTGRGWVTMVLLAVAYGLLEEGPIDQMLYNPGYLGLHSFAGFAQIPGLHLSAALLQGTLTVHTIWSICVPIALMEAVGSDRVRPWLGTLGLTVIGLLFVGGSVFLGVYQAQDLDFVGSAAQFGWSVAAIVALVVLAFVLGSRPVARTTAVAPGPVLVGLASFVVTSLYWVESAFEVLPEWLSVAWWFVLVGVGIALCWRWARCRNWGGTHVLGLAGGALLTYVWAGFTQSRDLDDVSTQVAVLGNVVFGIVATVLLLFVIRRARAVEEADGQRNQGSGRIEVETTTIQRSQS